MWGISVSCTYVVLTVITVDGHPVDSVNSFVYLGSLQSSDCYSRPDINRHIALASSVMASLQRIWKDRSLSTTTKIRVYQALVTSVSLYASETWTVLASDLQTLEAFHIKCQRQLIHVKWHQFVRNDQISAVTNLPSISSTISRRRNAVFGHRQT